MRREDFLNAMAMWGDAEQRSTATMVELVAAAVAAKVAPPAGDDVLRFEITDTDLADMLLQFRYETEYKDGKMTMFLTRLVPSADAG